MLCAVLREQHYTALCINIIAVFVVSVGTRVSDTPSEIMIFNLAQFQMVPDCSKSLVSEFNFH